MKLIPKCQKGTTTEFERYDQLGSQNKNNEVFNWKTYDEHNALGQRLGYSPEEISAHYQSGSPAVQTVSPEFALLSGKAQLGIGSSLANGLKNAVVKNAKIFMKSPQRRKDVFFGSLPLMVTTGRNLYNRFFGDDPNEVDATVTPNVRRYQQGEDY